MSSLVQVRKCSAVHLFEAFCFVCFLVYLSTWQHSKLENPGEINDNLKKILSRKDKICLDHEL